jgi:uncharacterized protein (DUF1501 family)
MTMVSRRDVLKTAGASLLTGAMPMVTLAGAETDSRFVLVILRGAADGLALVPPFGDGSYRRLRGELALPGPGQAGGALELDGLFGLHPALAATHDQYGRGHALVVHAVASPYRERSHFDGQDVLENGAAAVGRLRDGWLNRALTPLGSSLGNEVAIAMAQNTPLVLRGDSSVTSWAPSRLPDVDESTLSRLADLYAGDEFFSTRLAQALDAQAIAAAGTGIDGAGPRGNEAEQLRSAAEAAASFLVAAAGPRIAVIETGGWDTHANQGAGTGALANRLAALDTALATLREGLGDAWARTVVAVVTEFGRTVRVNGTRGTDHGTAGAAILLGGAVRGGRVLCHWPGLADGDLYEGRDLRPTTDLRAVFKGILCDHLDLAPGFVEREVFPDSSTAIRLADLIRA